MPPDPYYRSSPARWLLEAASWHSGLDIFIDRRLEDVAAKLEQGSRILRIPPGLPLETLVDAVSRSVMQELFPGSIPGFKPEYPPCRQRPA